MNLFLDICATLAALYLADYGLRYFVVPVNNFGKTRQAVARVRFWRSAMVFVLLAIVLGGVWL